MLGQSFIILSSSRGSVAGSYKLEKSLDMAKPIANSLHVPDPEVNFTKTAENPTAAQPVPFSCGSLAGTSPWGPFDAVGAFTKHE